MIEKRVSNVGIYCTVHQMYAESNVTSCICHKLGICTLVTDTGSHVTLRIHLMYSMPTFDTLLISLSYTLGIRLTLEC